MIPLLLALAIQAHGGGASLLADTMSLTLQDALATAVATAPALSAARSRADAADARNRQAGLWTNPLLSMTAENLGATEEVTGFRGLDGVEGQILLSPLLRLGGDRSALVARTRAERLEMEAAADMTEADLRLRVLETAATASQDRALAAYVREEAEGLDALALTLQRQAEAGRLSDGEAARARLAAVSGWTEVARADSRAAASNAELARLLGMDPSVPVVVEIPQCEGPWTPQEGPLPESALADARTQVARGRVREARAAAIPDVIPQVGLRRSGGHSALYMGLEIPVPLFDRNQGTREAARLERRAAEEDARALDTQLQAQRSAALRSLDATEAAGARFTPEWRAALERTVEAAEARYRLGEGTLTELLDSRRARLMALGDFQRWQAERVTWRARAARLSGQPITAESLCRGSRTSDSAPMTSSNNSLEDIR